MLRMQLEHLLELSRSCGKKSENHASFCFGAILGDAVADDHLSSCDPWALWRGRQVYITLLLIF